MTYDPAMHAKQPKPGIVKRGFCFIWHAFNFSRNVIVNLFFLVILIAVIGAMTSDDKKVTIPTDGAALVLHLSGHLVEQKTYVDPMDEITSEAFGGPKQETEVLVSDLVTAIHEAKKDDRIKAILLKVQGVSGHLDKLRQIGEALQEFKASGKKVIAQGDYFGKGPYFLASYADEIYINPYGGVLIDGYSTYRIYFSELLKKLKITTHIFRVGTHKSAVEPFMRDDMSPEAKESAKAWLGELWTQYKEEIVSRRENMDISNVDETYAGYIEKYERVNADFAQFALQYGWVDGLKNRDEMRQYMIELVGQDKENEETFAQVNFYDYLSLYKLPFPIENPQTDKVAVIVASGQILDGEQEPGLIGGESTARLLRKARMDDKVKAVVLRVDSPGGSAFASEVIRQEVEQIKAAGKPVIASMGSVAASGGYWISAPADEIWASPSTITGSIGIFGMFMTYENSLQHIGVNTDGVTTTEFGGAPLFRGLDPQMGQIIQMNVEHGYERFIKLVSENRKMKPEEVDKIAQGRVWTGAKAQELGLVDKLGDLDDAIDAAAQLASLTDFDVKYIEKELSARDKMIKELFGQAHALFGWDKSDYVQETTTSKVVQQFMHEAKAVNQFNDPQGVYARCEFCEVK
ncbi:signal peptide peptidase SppA [Algicola sagamiensis]|uniref:signal peptide peptidase SppA n=1 Tax=Algicola sagamiensis TaxID=163869 RepID=UPI000366EBCA|nr:signal peptide peptidase SppA [Algicola sagamiensis]